MVIGAIEQYQALHEVLLIGFWMAKKDVQYFTMFVVLHI